MEEAEKGGIFERNAKPRSMEEAEKGEVFDRNTKPRLDDHPEATVEAAGLFTDDIILEILSRLPVRSVHRFKCVSVSWRKLIAHPANRKKLPQTLSGFLYMTNDKSGERQLLDDKSGQRHHFANVSGGAAPFDHCLESSMYMDMTQVDACNGLLLYRARKRNWNTWAKDVFCFVVSNPVTWRWVELPPQPPAPANIRNCMAGLAFDPAVSSHFYVFHFEQTFQEPYITGVNIYSARTRAWSRRESGLAEKVVLCFPSKCVFVGGMMYMICINNEHVLLVGVDMEGKVWKTIRVPYGLRSGTIGSSQGCLHYAIDSVDGNNKGLGSEIELWCLKDCDSKELVLKHTTTSIVKLMSMTGKRYSVAEIHPDCDTIFMVSCGADTLVAYDMRHQKVGRIIHLEKNVTQLQRFLPYVPLFSDSLVDADEQ